MARIPNDKMSEYKDQIQYLYDREKERELKEKEEVSPMAGFLEEYKNRGGSMMVVLDAVDMVDNGGKTKPRVNLKAYLVSTPGEDYDKRNGGKDDN